MHPSRTHIGSFDGDALRRSPHRAPTPDSILHDLASALAALAFFSAVSFVLLAAWLPELPA